MNVWLLDYDKFCKVNKLQPVTNPVMFDNGNVPTVDGLFSTEIFGVSTRDRRWSFAYIDLNLYFLNPKVYLTLIRLNRNFESVIYGTKRYKIEGGVLVEDENGGTGLKWLYDNWEKIKFPRNDSSQRNERVDLLEINSKDIIFTNKFLVIPAFYRDINLQSTDDNPKVPEINDLYAKIIRNVQSIKDANKLDFMISAMTGKVQQLLVDVYNLIKEKIQGKNGYIRKFLMGKSIDYSARVVITAVPYNKNSVYEQEIDFYHTGIPLAYVCAELTPCIIWWVKRWFKNNIENQKNSYIIISKGKSYTCKLDNPESYYNEEYIEKKIAKYVKHPYTRFDPIELPISPEEMKRIGLKQNEPTYIRFSGRVLQPGELNTSTVEQETGTVVNRHLTWTDLLYQAAYDVSADKHVWITRYPVLDYLGSYTNKIAIISTRETVPMMVSGRIYKSYPKVDLSIKREDLDVTFRDTLTIHPAYLSVMSADHDGDQITSKIVFTIEANEESERLMKAKTNLLTVDGAGVRGIGNEGIQTLYAMTKFM